MFFEVCEQMYNIWNFYDILSPIKMPIGILRGLFVHMFICSFLFIIWLVFFIPRERLFRSHYTFTLISFWFTNVSNSEQDLEDMNILVSSANSLKVSLFSRTFRNIVYIYQECNKVPYSL